MTTFNAFLNIFCIAIYFKVNAYMHINTFSFLIRFSLKVSMETYLKDQYRFEKN